LIQHLAVVGLERGVGADLLQHRQSVGDIQAGIFRPVNRHKPSLQGAEVLQGELQDVRVEAHQLMDGLDVGPEGGEDLRESIW
jgi:hypothetical protein